MQNAMQSRVEYVCANFSDKSRSARFDMLVLDRILSNSASLFSLVVLCAAPGSTSADQGTWVMIYHCRRASRFWLLDIRYVALTSPWTGAAAETQIRLGATRGPVRACLPATPATVGVRVWLECARLALLSLFVAAGVSHVCGGTTRAGRERRLRRPATHSRAGLRRLTICGWWV